MAQSDTTDTHLITATDSDPAESTIIVESVLRSDFSKWYRERQRVRNIEEGKTYFNSPPTRPDPARHKPSSLLRCHRYAYYKRANAPKETPSPDGHFWVGSEVEDRVILPFLRDIAPEGVFVQNSIWSEATIETDIGDLSVKGVTDPVFVSESGEPHVVTEVKTTSSLKYRSEASEHHRAQLHAYLYALNTVYEHDVTGAVVYLDRETFDLKAFSEPFDRDFWRETVVPWMRQLTEYEQAGELPPATPQYEWECEYCAYRHRCGKTTEPYQDLPPQGLLTLFDEYPKERMVEYLDGHEEARLTPTLATKYPDLTERFDVSEWACPSCRSTREWNQVSWDGDTDNPPLCQRCASKGKMISLRGEPDFNP